MFSGCSGSEAASDAEAEDWRSNVDDGGTGGNAEAMTQKGQDGSAPGRGGAGMIFGILAYRVQQVKSLEAGIGILGKLLRVCWVKVVSV